MSNTVAPGGETPMRDDANEPSFAEENTGQTDRTPVRSSGVSEQEAKLREQAMSDLESKGGRFSKRKKSKKGSKPEKPKSSATLRRENDKKKRAMKLGVRYGGDRMKWALLQAGLVALVLLSVLSLLVANSKASKNDIEASVAEALAEGGRDFPRGEAVMWAGQVLRVWGTWDEGNTNSRELALSPYLSSGMPANAGWNGKGKQTVTYSSINPEPNISGPNHATIDAVYQVQDGTWRCIGIPVYAYKPKELSKDAAWAFTLAGNPTPVPCAPRTGTQTFANGEDPLTAGGMSANADIGRTLATDFFPGFFAAWAASDEASLTQFTVSGVRTVGLGGAMSSLPQPTIGETSVFIDKEGPVDGKTYKALVPVTWTVAGTTSQVTASYVVPVQRSGERWLVAGEPVPSMQSPEASGRAPANIPDPGQGETMPTYPSPSIAPSEPPATSEPRSTEPAKESSTSKDSESSTASPSESSSSESSSSESSSSEPSPKSTSGASATSESEDTP